MFRYLFLNLAVNVLLLGVLYGASGKAEYRAVSRYDYYTDEEDVELVIWVPSSLAVSATAVDIEYDGRQLIKGKETTPGQFNVFSFSLDLLRQGDNEVVVSYFEDGSLKTSDKLDVVVRPHRYNAVKIDRLSGGLIVEGLPFYPFGFYNYSPVQPGLAEEEVVKGFNMMSPYQKIEGKTLKERKEYMDRCAALGMKVNYNLLSIAGGGGVGSKQYDRFSRQKQEKLLREEVEAFRDHPALLSWYISDEPVGQGVPPDSLEFAYGIIKELDPYHPVAIVFMAPNMAVDYRHVMDVVMADPYVIPNGKVADVGKTAAMLYEDFFLEKPVWIVPQAFGGNEWWEREPTRQELRAMTYGALVNHAMGIQYFIRHGLNSFPKSTTAWNECGTMALAFAEITPFLFSPDPVPVITVSDEAVQLRGFHLNGSYLLVAVNTVNEPRTFSFTISDLRYNGSVNVLFEDRQVEIIEGKSEDIIDAYGSRVYKITYKMLLSEGPRIHPQNLLKDPSFEDITGLGIPASCYAMPMSDRGATYFTDSRVAARGDHSVRMTAPVNGGGMNLSFMRIRTEPGHSYTLSIHARALPLKYRERKETGFFARLFGGKREQESYPEFSLGMDKTHSRIFTPDSTWKEYSYSLVPEPDNGLNQVSPALSLHGQGTAWFDVIQLYPDMEVKSFVSRDFSHIMVRLTSTHKGSEIFYTLDGSEPGMQSTPFKGNFKLSESAVVRAAAYKGGKRVGYLEKPYKVHLATGRYVEYKHKYSPKYNAGYNDGLVDGILGTADFKDGKWQGFEGDNLDVTIHLKEVSSVKRVTLRFLVEQASWIFMPADVKVSWSEDGVEYHLLEHRSFEDRQSEDGIQELVFETGGLGAKYFKIRAKNIGVCPEGHPGEGGKAWLFTDEIIIE